MAARRRKLNTIKSIFILTSPTHLSLGQLAACLALQEGHLGQVAVGIAGSEEHGGVCGDEHVGSDHDGRLGRGKGVVFDGALRCITVDEVAALR